MPARRPRPARRAGQAPTAPRSAGWSTRSRRGPPRLRRPEFPDATRPDALRGRRGARRLRGDRRPGRERRRGTGRFGGGGGLGGGLLPLLIGLLFRGRSGKVSWVVIVVVV